MNSHLRFVDERVPAWGHRAMTRFDRGVTAQEAVAQADLDYEVQKVPILVSMDGHEIPVKDRFALVNPRTLQAYGVVGANYQYMQNRELAAAMDTEITRHYPVVATGETLNHEGLLFVLDAGESSIMGEGLHQYFLFVEMRDGKAALQWAYTALRFWCTNTLMTALHQASAALAATHNRQFRISVEGGMRWIGHAEEARKRTNELFEAMAGRPLLPAEAGEYFETVWPLPQDAKLQALENVIREGSSHYLDTVYTRKLENWAYRKEKAEERRDFAARLFEYWGTDQPQLRGSLWSAYNVVAEIEDHVIGATNKVDSVRQSALLGPRAANKVRAMDAAALILKGAPLDLPNVVEGEFTALEA